MFSRCYVHLRSGPDRGARPRRRRPRKLVSSRRSKARRSVQVLPGTSKFDPKTKEVVTTYKLKNMSSAPIAMLKLDEYWYKDQKMVSTDTKRYMQPFRPGEIIEVTTRAPADGNPAGWSKNVTFSHANGKVTPKAVKAF